MLGEHFLVNPFVVNKLLYTQFNELRRRFISDFTEENSKILLNSCFEGVNPYLFYRENDSVVVLINGTIENFPTVKFSIKGIDFNKIKIIEKDGKEREIKYKVNKLDVEAEHEFNNMSAVVLRLIRE